MKPIRRLINLTQRAWHQWCASNDALYLRACAADGLVDSLSLRAFRDQLAWRECRLIELRREWEAMR